MQQKAPVKKLKESELLEIHQKLETLTIWDRISILELLSGIDVPSSKMNEELALLGAKLLLVRINMNAKEFFDEFHELDARVWTSEDAKTMGHQEEHNKRR